MIVSFLGLGGSIFPCAKLRAYEAEQLSDGIELIGSKAVFERMKAGAETISFCVNGNVCSIARSSS